MHYKKLSLFTLALVAGLVALPAQAQVGNCEPAIGEKYLDVNNVRARILNNGNLFWAGDPAIYEIPKGGGNSTIFASSIWLAGFVGTQLRAAATTYGPYEFWAGPLGDDASPPADCSVYDRVYKVNTSDVISYEGGGVASPDLQDWPTGLGAPTLDPNGDPIDLTGEPLASRKDRKINLGAGERPDILGDQMLWWVMNDMGNTHDDSGSPPIGLEAHVSAFAFNTAGAIGNTTFYKYRLFYKGDVPLTDTYMALWSDPDLGNFDDDYVGSDTTLGLGYVYNSDDDDEGGYGADVPASGYDFFQGPLTDSDGLDNNGDGVVDEPGERLKMTSFMYFDNGGGATGGPTSGEEFHRLSQGRWRDGQRVTFGGNGRDFSTIPSSFMFTGNPPDFWTEYNADGAGTAIAPADRRMVMASGPFTINPNDEQEIVFGIVTSFGGSALGSLAKLKEDDLLAQAVFDIDFALPSPPASPRVTVTELSGEVILEWGYIPTDNNYQESYRVIDPLLSEDVDDNDYNFEGYNVFQFASASDQTGTLLAVYDVDNGIGRVIEGLGLTFLSAQGSDSGVQRFHTIGGLTNYTTYYFGVQAYAYNEESGAKVYAGPITRLRATPANIAMSEGGTTISTAASAALGENTRFDFSSIAEAIELGAVAITKDGKGGGAVSADVVNPVRLQSDSYRVEFVGAETSVAAPRIIQIDENADDNVTRSSIAPKSAAATVTTYNVFRGSTKVFDGEAASLATGAGAPQGNNVQVIDGLSFSIDGPAPGPLDLDGAETWAFLEVAGPDENYACGSGAGSTFGCDFGGNFVYGSYNGALTYVMYHQGAGPEASLAGYAPQDYEIRFTEEGGYMSNPFGGDDHFWVPFEVWDIGPTATATNAGVNDPSDDVRMIPQSFSPGGNVDERWQYGQTASPFFGSGTNGATDRIYAYYPTTTYEDWEALVKPNVDANGGFWVDGGGAQWDLIDFGRGRPLQRIIFDDATGDPNVLYPATGVVVRFITTKPHLPGDMFSFSTDGYGVDTADNTARIEALDQIGIVPNPYKGASAYEVSQLVDHVRFTNMPTTATINVFALNGTLIASLQKNGPDRFFAWDITTDEGLPLASGMYIIHIETEFGDRVLKFGVVKKRVQLNTF